MYRGSIPIRLCQLVLQLLPRSIVNNREHATEDLQDPIMVLPDAVEAPLSEMYNNGLCKILLCDKDSKPDTCIPQPFHLDPKALTYEKQSHKSSDIACILLTVEWSLHEGFSYDIEPLFHHERCSLEVNSVPQNFLSQTHEELSNHLSG